MKKLVFLLIVFALALGAGCKKKQAPVEAPPPPPPPPPKQTEQQFISGLISHVPTLELGKTLEVQVDRSRVETSESSFMISLFPKEFIYPAGREYVIKYMFASVVWRLPDSQLLVEDLPSYLDTKPGEKIWILKDSPDPNKPFNHIPTLLVENKDKSRFWLLDSG